MVMTLLLGSVASVSLVVGGVGIMNIMLVSVTERTREIGIRLAVGARCRDILRQFLVEAVVLSTLGGVIGIALGVAAAVATTAVVNALLRATCTGRLTISVEAIVVALVFSGSVGMFFGYYPARRPAGSIPSNRCGTNEAAVCFGCGSQGGGGSSQRSLLYHAPREHFRCVVLHRVGRRATTSTVAKHAALEQPPQRAVEGPSDPATALFPKSVRPAP